jgi:hypothetical protein
MPAWRLRVPIRRVPKSLSALAAGDGWPAPAATRDPAPPGAPRGVRMFRLGADRPFVI